MDSRRSLLQSLVVICALSAAYSVVILSTTNQYYLLVLTQVCVWAVLGISWNILSGYSGLVSFGHAAFFGLGAYTVAIGALSFGLSPWLTIPLAGLVGAMAGLVVGIPTFRLRGHYFGLAMLAYPLALLNIFEWLGYQEVALPMHREATALYMQYNDARVYCFIGLAMLVAAVVVSVLIENSRFGMSLKAIKQNELAAEGAGIDTRRWKLRAIAISGAVAGMIGGYYAVVLIVVTPQSVFGMFTSAQALIVALFGGVGVVWGPIIVAMVLIPLSELFQAKLGNLLPGIQGVVFGIAIVLVILLAPEGIYWKVRDVFHKRRQSNRAPAGLTPAASVEMPALRPREILRGPVVLEVRNLSKSFGGLKAVQDVSFKVPAHSIVGIIGPNGAGKTTLFNLLNGYQTPDAGQVMFEGKGIVGLMPNAVCKLGIGRTFQVARPFARLSVLQNVLVGAYVAAPDGATALANARSALAMVGLSAEADSIAGGLTNKHQRLMELARALAGKPKLVFLDEILAGLGSGEINEILPVIRKLADEGITVLIIEHTMQAMLRLADHFIVLDHGALLTEGDPKIVMKQPAVIEAYLGKRWRERA